MKIIGHRGARGLAPENTLEGIQAALAAGVDGIEIDAHVTADNVIVLSHDPYIIDEKQNRWNISQHSYEFLRQRSAHLAQLAAVVTVLPLSVELRIEIKPGQPIEPFVTLLRPIVKERQFAVVSFDYPLLQSLHQAAPEIPLILNEKWSSVRAHLRARKLGTKRLQMNERWLWRGFLKAVQRGGYLLTPYTVNSVKRARKWEPYVEGIITDYPDRFTHK